MNLRRLKYFVKIVDVGSLTQAAEILHIAQPALSQQIATLESEFRQQLLLRTKRGVTPTEAGRVLYRHAQLMLKQFEQAQADVRNSGRALSGQVSVGLAPGTAASALALPLLKAVRGRHPDVVLYLNENLGTTLCEQVGNGRMDMAVLYGGRSIVQGLSFEPLLTEELVLVTPAGDMGDPQPVALADLRHVELLLPRAHNYLRQYVDEAFASLQMVPRVVAEIESAATLSAAVASGVAATVLPASAARAVAESIQARICRIVSPAIEVPLALCTSDRLPLSEPAQAVRAIILELADGLETP
ncbi:nitrogen assimilation transcriptional regulator NAC [Aquabacterium sp.]|uniref:nitrogen assimilation transcriptional regulator NAC n=1 Tax=Aquabacterium sp. TaxID=1872578 RepID=UPI002BF1EA18|nr:nitrogen assimilation transcriptional regulator NAC [Aquabacterium sp.]HSW03995.1 nitrogen assimilation transcriptional regulator NAC [Aquabacterium sp.]